MIDRTNTTTAPFTATAAPTIQFGGSGDSYNMYPNMLQVIGNSTAGVTTNVTFGNLTLSYNPAPTVVLAVTNNDPTSPSSCR